MTKQKLAQLVLTEEELKNIDYALPQPYVDWCRSNNAPDPRLYQIWSHLNDIIGHPINLAERFIQKFNNLSNIIGNADLDKEKVGAMYATLSLVNEALNL